MTLIQIFWFFQVKVWSDKNGFFKHAQVLLLRLRIYWFKNTQCVLSAKKPPKAHSDILISFVKHQIISNLLLLNLILDSGYPVSKVFCHFFNTGPKDVINLEVEAFYKIWSKESSHFQIWLITSNYIKVIFIVDPNLFNLTKIYLLTLEVIIED